MKVIVKKKDKAIPVVIGTEFIKLESAMKLANIVISGGSAKLVIQEGNVTVNGEKVETKTVNGTLSITVTAGAEDTTEITVENCAYLKNMERRQALIHTVAKFQTLNDTKNKFNKMLKTGRIPAGISKEFAGPIKEIFALD